uniref:Uncharacterized protein n=1 Tax=Rhizophora mucronata TaxID=61149 RepID=A0A2P2PHT5_RHIMU
MFCFPFSWN